MILNDMFIRTIILIFYYIFALRVQCSLIRNVGQDAVFMWNRTSGSIDQVKWGLLNDAQLIKPRFIYIKTSANVPVYSSDLDTPAGSAYKGRVSYVGDLSAGHAWFKLTNLSIGDTKSYAAKILEESVENIYEITLIVAVSPAFLPSHPERAYQIIEGQDLKINCTANGPPTPNITWVNITDGSIESQGSGNAILSIDNIQRYNAGVYECQANNNPNEDATKTTTNLTVYYPPEINKTATLDVLGCIGREVRLFCKASGSPKPSIKWIDPNDKERFINVSSPLFKLKDSSAFGNYTCTVNNRLGNDSYVISLTEGACTTPTPKTDVPAGIIAGVVIAGILAIAGLIIALIFCYRRKSLDRDSFRSGAQQERTVQMSSLRNQEEQYASVQHQQDRGSSTEPIPQYALVDKNKKKKHNPDGLIYADLDLDSMDNLERRPSSGGHPTLEAGSTVYADIAGDKKHHPEPQYGNLQAKDFSI